MALHLVLFQPDIPGNTGTILRMAACLDIKLHIIEPAGFDVSDRSFKRAGMDYIAKANLIRHKSWEEFLLWAQEDSRRIILLTTKTENSYLDYTFKDEDLILLGRESAGVPDYVQDEATHCCTIPMSQGARSLNLAIAAAMVAGEAIRQVRYPKTI